MLELMHRSNFAERSEGKWRPPLFRPASGGSARFMAVLRRFFDLQAKSIWNDLAVSLPQCTGTVLDVGCGAQPYRALFPSGVRYLGIDCADANQHFGYQSVDTVYFSGGHWPIADHVIDVVLSTETLEHVFDYAGFLAEAYRCLKPGGRLLLTVPFAARWHYIPNDYWRFTPSSLQLLLTRVGFSDISVYARGNALSVACYKLMALILPLLMPQHARSLTKLFLQTLGLALSPPFIILAIIGNLSLNGEGEDCLGYTVLASRPRNAD